MASLVYFNTNRTCKQML